VYDFLYVVTGNMHTSVLVRKRNGTERENLIPDKKSQTVTYRDLAEKLGCTLTTRPDLTFHPPRRNVYRDEISRLWNYHVTALLLQYITLVCLVYVVGDRHLLDLKVYVYDNTSGWNAATRSVTVGPTTHAFRANLAVAIIASVLCAVFSQTVYVFYLCSAQIENATKRSENGPGNAFIQDVAFGRNRVRWVEYTISAPCMIYVIAYFSGIVSMAPLLSTCLLIGVTQCFGAVCDEHNCNLKENIYWKLILHEKLSKTENLAETGNLEKEKLEIVATKTKSRLWPHVLGWFPFSAAWFLILARFITISFQNESTPPTIVKYIVLIEAICFTSFGLVQILVLYRKYSREVCIRAERYYATLSALAKTALAWLYIYALYNPDS
jgi:hypothetical protein